MIFCYNSPIQKKRGDENAALLLIFGGLIGLALGVAVLLEYGAL